MGRRIERRFPALIAAVMVLVGVIIILIGVVAEGDTMSFNLDYLLTSLGMAIITSALPVFLVTRYLKKEDILDNVVQYCVLRIVSG